jgi:4-alpha-glucanotransferase
MAFPSTMLRTAGVLVPLFSLRSSTDWGVGEIPDLVPFARWAAGSGIQVVQVLPVAEAARGQNSPYAALSAFAIDPVYLAIDALDDFTAAGGHDALTAADQRLLREVRASPTVRWNEVRALKTRALELAFQAFVQQQWQLKTRRARELERFAREQSTWIDDYALFVSIHDEAMGGRSWVEWPAPLRDREMGALADIRAQLSERVLFRVWLQWLCDRQWQAARRGANAVGVELAGDIPFMVATDSADVWARRHDFRLDARVGVPPDAFSATGQDWGLPVYRWADMEAAGHVWMTARAGRMADLYGLYRVDHVVGLYRTYYFPNDGSPAAFVPSEEPAQIANGERMLALFSERARVIAEDLGVVPDFIRRSLDELAVPGYRVQRWEREWKLPGQPFRDPSRWPSVSVATTGTHDTDSLADWYESLNEGDRRQLLAIPGLASLRERAPARFDDSVRDALLELLFASGSDLLLLPFQDLFGHRERVNVPGTVNDQNWTYRIPATLAQLVADADSRRRLRSLAERHGRTTPR